MKHLGFIVKFCLSAGILAALFLRLDIDMAEGFSRRAGLPVLAVATLLVGLQAFLLAMRWKILVNVGKTYLTLRRSVSISFISNLANMVFITSIGGLVARITLTMPTGASFQKCVAASVIDRIMTFCALALIAGLFLPVFALHSPSPVVRTAMPFIIAAIIGSIILAPIVVAALYRRITSFTTMPRLRALRRYAGAFFGRPRIYSKTVFVSLIAQSAFLASVIILTKAAGAEAGIVPLLSMLPVIALISSLPVSIGGWGVREGAFVYGYGLLGIPMETAFVISIQVGLIGMLASVLLGLPALMAARFPALSGFRKFET